MRSLSIRPGLRRFGRILSVLLGLSLGHVGLFGSAGDSLVSIDGHKASANRVIARESGDIAAASSSRVSGVSVEARSRLVSGLVVLSVDLEEAVSTSAAGAASTEPTADRLIRRIKELRASGRYEYVEPDWVVSTFQAEPSPSPDDAAFEDGRLWGLLNEGQNGGTAGIDINVEPAWQIAGGGDPSVVIGVVDTGVRFTHQDLAENMWENPGELADNGIDDNNSGFVDDVFGIDAIRRDGNPIDRNGHGTHVAGTIAATAFNDAPHVGVAFNTRIMALKFLNDIGFGFTSDAILAIDYGVANGAHILNNSWGGGSRSAALLQSIEAANEAGVLFIAAAGNDGEDNDTFDSFPANYDVPNVISVAALDRRGELAEFSNFGAESVHIAAPGVSIFSSSADSDRSYESLQGTSMAAPHVAGVAALLKSQFPSAGIPELRTRLLSTARSLESLEGKIASGGIVDAEAALNLTEDGILELSARAPELLVEGREGLIYVSVSDLFPVTDATVSASFEGIVEATLFRDDGVAPDRKAGDGIYSAFVPIPDNTNAATLVVDASAPGKEDAQASFDFQIFGPPANNDFENSEILLPGTSLATGTNLLADAESGEPLPFSGGKTVWWQWHAPEDGEVSISTLGSDFDTGLAVFIGSDLTSLVQITSNDDASGTFQSEVTFDALAGTTYYLQVDGVRGSVGDIVLRYPGPGSTTPGGVFIRSNPQDQTVRHNRSFTLTVDAGGSSPLSYQWYFFGLDEAVEDAVELSGADAAELTIDFASQDAEGSYFVRVSNSIDSVDSTPALITVTLPGAELPVNDDIADALELPIGDEDVSAPSNSGSLTGSNVDATREPGEPNHAGAAAPQSSVWYRWQPPTSGVLRLDTFGTVFDTVLSVYTASSVDPGVADLIEVASNDDAPGTTASELEFAVVAGESLFIAVDGFRGAEGAFRLAYQFLPEGNGSNNDDFADRIGIVLAPGTSETVFGSNVGASHESGEPNHAGTSLPGGQSVWWSFSAPVSGPVEISTEGSNFDTVLAVYRGSSVNGLSLVKANDDAPGLGRQSRIRLNANAGEVFAIAVDGFGNAQGNIQLTLEALPEAPAADAGRVLLIDAFGGFGNTAQVLRGFGYSVTVQINGRQGDYSVLRDSAFLADFEWVIFAPRGVGEELSPAVVSALAAYVSDGGSLLVTGFDTLARPADDGLAALLGLKSPRDLSSVTEANWAFEALDHPILNGPFGDLRGREQPGFVYDFDAFEADTDRGTLVLALLGDLDGTPRLTFRENGSGGSVGYWNGGLRPADGDAQPDFNKNGLARSLFSNYAHFVMEVLSDDAEVGPVIFAQPADLALSVGDSAPIEVVASSPHSLSYQWYKDGALLRGANGKALLIEANAAVDGGHYSVLVTDTLGRQTFSQVAVVQVSDASNSEGGDALPHALPVPLHGATALGGDWYNLPWFGSFAAPAGLETSWIFRNDLGWLFIAPSGSAEGFWSWSDALSSWIWTSESAAGNGFYYDWNEADWIFIHAKPSGFGAWLRSSQFGVWTELSF